MAAIDTACAQARGLRDLIDHVPVLTDEWDAADDGTLRAALAEIQAELDDRAADRRLARPSCRTEPRR